MPKLTINTQTITVEEGTSVAAAIMMHTDSTARISIKGEERAPLCGMGICYECRAKIDGIEHTRTCMTVCQDDMEVTTNE